MARIHLIDPASLTREQIPVFEAIIANENRKGRLPAPYKVALHSPTFCNILQQMGGFLRYKTSLPRRISELAIIITGRQWTCQTEWISHAPVAMEAGISPSAAEAIRLGKTPHFDKAEEQAVYDFCVELHDSKFVSADTHKRVLDLYGANGMVELVGLVGYYTTVAMLLNSQNYESTISQPLPLPSL